MVPDTFFVPRKARTSIELFDFMHESYRNTSKEKLLEWMKDASDFAELEKLTQAELSEVYCERCVYSIVAGQKKKETERAQGKQK